MSLAPPLSQKNITLKNNPSINTSITFIQYWLPALSPGAYTLNVTQNITIASNPIVNRSYPLQKQIAISAEQFQLNPSNFYACYPPLDAVGQYDNCLAHVVLTNKTLPWLRSITSDASDNNASWLALLLFDEADIGAPQLQSGTIADLMSAPLGKLPSGIYFPNLNFDLYFSLGGSITDSCNFIDVPSELFSAIAPTATDLQWLAHGRTVSLKQKMFNPNIKSRINESGDDILGDFSVVICNRLPTKNHESTLFLVSLEAYASVLPPGSPGKDFVRLICFYNSNFFTESPLHDFASTMQNLNLGALQLPTPTPPPSSSYVQNAVAMGYTAVNHLTRGNDQLVSWYRGPLAPYAIGNFSQALNEVSALPLSSSDAALQYDPDTGMFDVSYAVAWQLGQLLALHDQQFAISLYNWKRNNVRNTINLAEQALIDKILTPAPTSKPTRRDYMQRTIAGKLKDILLDFSQSFIKKE